MNPYGDSCKGLVLHPCDRPFLKAEYCNKLDLSQEILWLTILATDWTERNLKLAMEGNPISRTEYLTWWKGM